MRKFLLLLILATAPAFADSLMIAEATSPDERFTVVPGNTAHIHFEDATTHQDAGFIAMGDAWTINAVIGKWSPDASKAAIELRHRQWSETLVFVRENDHFRPIDFDPPDVIALYEAQRPPRRPRYLYLKDITHAHAVGPWLNNSAVSLTGSYIVGDLEHSHDGDYTLKATYTLKLIQGRAEIHDAKLKLAPR